MPRGGPDFGATAPRELTTPQLDSGELAARLGSPNVYDRLGTVVGLFRGELPAQTVAGSHSGSGRIDSWVAGTPFGAYAWRLAVLTNVDVARSRFLVPFIGASPVGVEVVYRHNTSILVTAELSLELDDGVDATQAGLRWDASTSAWQFLNSAGVFVDTPTQASDPPLDAWNSVKVTVDPDGQTYGRALANGADLGLGGISARDTVSTARRIAPLFNASGVAAAARSIDVAAVIVTVNEL